MELYKDQEVFYDAIKEASRALKINEALIEKDYFVMYILSELNKVIPGLLFKGGTSCSHAYKIINRFSEDIDLSLNSQFFGRNHNIKANKLLIDTCDRLGFKIINRNDVEKHTHGNFNRYYIEYPISFQSQYVKPYVQIEMTFYMKPYPEEVKSINSILGDWLINSGNQDYAVKYNMMPFDICVQCIERTFIDKVFAICDYFERNEVTRNSRHIYDLYQIFNTLVIKDDFKELINDVRKDRSNNSKCISAQDGYNINSTLKYIVDTKFYKKDYDNITMLLLTKIVDYDTAIKVINQIIDSKLFS